VVVRYEEHVHGPRWLTLLGFLAAVGSLAGGGMALIDKGSGLTSRVAAGLVILGLGPLLFWLSLTFNHLKVRVTDDGVRFQFGPVGKSINTSEIIAVEVEPYGWLSYGGWGIRFSTRGRRAYSVPGHPRGVALQIRDGARYHISSGSPEALASTIRNLLTENSR
jgi:hypothetical protein